MPVHRMPPRRTVRIVVDVPAVTRHHRSTNTWSAETRHRSLQFSTSDYPDERHALDALGQMLTSYLLDEIDIG